MDADRVEVRVLGSLLEKQRTTPDQYPLSLNALRLACNQSTNRDPVVDYDEPAIRRALDTLTRRGWVRLASGRGSRAAKYRQLFTDVLGLQEDQAAVLTVLMLRGPQTLGELKQRTERMHRFGSLDDVERTLGALAERELAARQARRPGERDDRYTHLLGAAEVEAAEAVPQPVAGSLEERVRGLEDRVRRLEELSAELRPRG